MKEKKRDTNRKQKHPAHNQVKRKQLMRRLSEIDNETRVKLIKGISESKYSDASLSIENVVTVKIVNQEYKIKILEKISEGIMKIENLENKERGIRIDISKILAQKKEKKDIDIENLKGLVKQAESLRKQIDIQSGFSEAQALTHDLVLRIPELQPGNVKFSSGRLFDFLSNLQEIIQTVKPGIFNIAEYKIMAVAPGSESLMLDLRIKEEIEETPKNEESIEETSKKLAEILSLSQTFAEKGAIQEKVDNIKKQTGLSTPEIYEVSKKALNLYPEPSSLYANIGVAVNTKNKNTPLTFNRDDRLQMKKNKELLYQSVKPEDTTMIFGQLQVMEEWDKNHKISIFDNSEGQPYTVHYEPTKKNLEIIKSNIGSYVRIMRERNPDDKRKWLLKEWLN